MTSLYELSTNGWLARAEPAGCPPAWLTDGVVRWVRMVAPPLQEIESRLRPLELPGELMEAPSREDVRARVAVHRERLLVTFPALVPGETRAMPLRLILTPTALISIEEQALPAINRVAAELSGQERTLLHLLIDMLEAGLESAGLMYLTLRRSLDDLAEKVEEQPLAVPPDALLAMRRRVGQLSILWEEQAHGLMDLQRRRSLIFTSDSAREQLRDMISDADRGMKLLAGMEARVRDLRQHHMNCLQESTNRRLNVLAILSAIYLPATLIAGIYGMNFEHIPVTQVPYGYFIVMAMMAVVVLGQIWYFRRRGWFK